MRRSRTPAIIAVVLLGTALAFALLRQPAEPRYQGRDLSDWIEGMNANPHPEDGPEETAIREIGTNALPTLLVWVRTHDSPFKLWWTGLMSHHDWLPGHATAHQHSRNDYAVSAFDVLGPDAAPAVPELAKMMNSSDPAVRADVACCLGEIGEAAADANPQLIHALDDDDEAVRQQAAWALGCIRENAAQIVPILERKLPDETPAVQQYVMYALGLFGSDAKSAVPLLLKFLGANQNGEPFDPEIRSAAANALGEIGGNEDVVIPALLTALRDVDIQVRSEAANALGKFGSKARPAVPALVKLLQETASDAGEPDAPDLADLRGSAASALGNIQTDADTVVPALINSVMDSDDQARMLKVQALGEYGEAAKSALPTLERLLKDEDADVRASVTNALLSIDPKTAAKHGIQ